MIFNDIFLNNDVFSLKDLFKKQKKIVELNKMKKKHEKLEKNRERIH